MVFTKKSSLLQHLPVCLFFLRCSVSWGTRKLLNGFYGCRERVPWSTIRGSVVVCVVVHTVYTDRTEQRGLIVYLTPKFVEWYCQNLKLLTYFIERPMKCKRMKGLWAIIVGRFTLPTPFLFDASQYLQHTRHTRVQCEP